MAVPDNTYQADGQSSVSASQLNTYVQACTNVATLRGFIGLTNMQVYMAGYVTTGDGGEGQFIYSASSTAEDDGGVTAIKPVDAGSTGRWIRIGTLSGAVGTIIQCTASGTNTIVLTPLSGQPTISGYEDGQLFGFVTPNTSSGSVTIQYQSLTALPAYTLALSVAASGDFVADTYWIVTYSSVLNSGTGGFQQVASLPSSVSASTVSYSPTTSGQPASVNTAQLAIDAGFSTVSNNQVLCPYKNLSVAYATASTVTITADALVLFNSAGYARKYSSISLTADITASGANGLDTGTEATSTWYHIWVIAQQAGTVASLLSVSPTAPTMPANYIFMGYVGAVYNNGSNNFVVFSQKGNMVAVSLTNTLSAGTQTSYTAVSLAAAVPTTATSVLVQNIVNSSNSTSNVFLEVSSEGSGTSATYGFISVTRLYASAAGDGAISSGELLLTTPQQIKYYVTGTNANGYIRVNGWRY